jgi:molybdopterin synthase catalytic subunit
MSSDERVATGLTAEPLDVSAAITAVASPAAGGIGVFVGTVRASAAVPEHSGEQVVRLEYEAHETLAARRLDEIAHEAAGKWDLTRVAAFHRTGACELGEPTVVVACAAAHRGAALDACRWVIDELKQTVPIFKREVYASGASWVGAEGAL